MPYSVTIDPTVLAAILSWGLSKTMLDCIHHHLTQVLPSAPDQHLAEAVVPHAFTFACPLTLADDRPGRKGEQIHFRFAVYRRDNQQLLTILAGRVAEEEHDGGEAPGAEA